MDNPLDSEFTEEIKKALQNNNQALAVAKIQEYLDKKKNYPLNIAVTGKGSSGKSTFVNAFRGIDNSDEEAAPTDETTSEVTPYPHPKYPNVTLWDLPGVGTTEFPANKYLELVEFEKFDFFIIISDTCFRENDVKLAQEIQKMGKKFYFVRSKIDNDLRAEKRSKREFDEKKTITQIKENCIQGLQQQGVESPQVFLVSSFELKLHDFPLLHRTLEGELPAHQRNALLLAMPNINLEIINRKKEAFQAKIKYFATLSAAVAAVPVPGLSVAVDVALMVGVVSKYVVGFGLDSSSLKSLAGSTGVPLKDLTTAIRSQLAVTKITPFLIMKLLTQCVSTAASMAAEEGSGFIPVFGILAAVTLSLITTNRTLNSFLNMFAEDAHTVFKRALGLKTSV
ncbi:interferon-inducible GTPase 5-like isoform X2 [Dicentrarchus labrax]|uniref:interferon-inducible GTPase 5-like isoform X2 n=1 Tax=Dicentrarchus labrax TaxID=13489 RepID=UPI0021F58202|nr:interferon-inducible GTPase 5-like isoform X2 [Dicentrarchus labrax]